MKKVARIITTFILVYLTLGFIVTSVIYELTELSGGVPNAYFDSGFWLTVFVWPLGILAYYYGQ